MSVPGGIHTNAPSWRNPVFSAVNAWPSEGANRPRYGSAAAGLVAPTAPLTYALTPRWRPRTGRSAAPEPIPAECADPAFDQIRRDSALTIVRKREMPIGDRCDTGELPFLIARRWKAGVREVLDPLPAQIPQPCRLGRGTGGHKAIGIGQIGVDLRGGLEPVWQAGGTTLSRA